MIAKKQLSGLKVAVLMGGVGAERQVSIESGQAVADAVSRAGAEVAAADVGPDDLSILCDSDVDVFFNALHGEFGEDGTIQAIMEDLPVVFTGSGSAASRRAFDKMVSKKIFSQAGMAVPAAIEICEEEDFVGLQGRLEKMGDKFVVKPIRQGSSVGIEIIQGSATAAAAARRCLAEFGSCMVEEYVDGREITVGIVAGEPMDIIEIKSANHFYDYQAKYSDERTEYLFDTIADGGVVEAVKRAAVKGFEVLGCRGFGRADFILTDSGEFKILEFNTIPGFTCHSLLPMAAERAGMGMEDLCSAIAKGTLARTKGKESSLVYGR